jgi:hypothetical protein
VTYGPLWYQKNVRRHRLISIDYITTPVTAEVASSSLVVPAILSKELTESVPFSRGHKKAQNRYRKLEFFQAELTSPAFFLGTRARRLPPALFRCDCRRVCVESHTNCRRAQQFLHDLQLCTGRSKQRRMGVTKSMPADSLCDGQFSRNRNDMVPHDLLGQERPATLVDRTREYPAL